MVDEGLGFCEKGDRMISQENCDDCEQDCEVG